jgi:hypothetical protein
VALLWRGYVGLAVAVAMSSLIAIAAGDGASKEAFRWLASKFGRARILGFGALAIEVVRVAGSSQSQALTLAIGVAVSMALTGLDWYRLLIGLPGARSALATIEVATEPNLVLLATDRLIPLNARVRVTAEGSAVGTVVAQLAHKSGSRYQVALDASWRTLTSHGASDCTVEILSDLSDAVGFAAEGSTERTLEVHPVEDLTHGQPIVVRSGASSILYQVSSLRLERNAWENSSVIEPRARAAQVGSVGIDGRVQFLPHLPRPYEALVSGGTLTSSVPEGYRRLGVVVGTQIEIGLSLGEGDGHISILGMSGMGKTTVARRLSTHLSEDSMVAVLDSTGEYKTRLGLAAMDLPSGLTELGESVHEAGGVPARTCRDFIHSVMDVAHGEYETGTNPLGRVVLIEEAHSFLPEWNFTSGRTESDLVAESCRYILQARKYGIRFIFVSQRTAVISKSALSQCESYVIFRTLDQTSLDYIEGVVGKDYREAVASLPRYQAMCVGPAFNCSSPVIVEIDP